LVLLHDGALAAGQLDAPVVVGRAVKAATLKLVLGEG